MYHTNDKKERHDSYNLLSRNQPSGELSWGRALRYALAYESLDLDAQIASDFKSNPLARESLNGGSQMGAQGHTLQFAHNRLQLCTFVAVLGPFLRGTFVARWRHL